MRLGHEPGRATCLVVKCPDDEMSSAQLSFDVCGEVSSSLNRMSENVLPTAKGQTEESAKGICDKTWKTTEHIATCKVVHGDVNAHHALEFGQTMVK